MSENNTPDENFGFNPGNPSGTPSGPAIYEPSQELTVAKGLDLSSADIDALAMAIRVEDPDGIRSAGRAWENLSDQFVESMGALRRAGTTLQEHWESPSASEAFLNHVGRATWSVEDWQSALGKNAGAMNSLASQVERHKKNMATLYGQYLLALAAARAQDDVEATDPMARQVGQAARGGKSAVEAAKDEYSARARSEVATPLDADYSSAFLKISRGAKWQGPTNAAIPQPAAPPSPGGAGAPGGPGVAPSGPVGVRPGAPSGATPASPTGAAIGAPTAPSGPAGAGATAPQAPGGTPSVPPGMPMGPAGLPPAAPGSLPGALTGAGSAPQGVDSASLEGMRQQLEGPAAAPAAPGTVPAALTGRGPAPSAPSGTLPARPSGPAPARPGAGSGLFRPGGPGGPAPGAPLTGRPTAPGGGSPGRGAPPGAPGGARPAAPGGPGGPGKGLSGRNFPTAPGGRPAGPGAAGPSKGLAGRAAPVAPGGRPGGPGSGAPRAPRGADAGFARNGSGPGAGAPTAPRGGAGTRPEGPAGPGRVGVPQSTAPSAPRGGMPSRLAGRSEAATAARAGARPDRPSAATKPALVAKDLNGRLGIRPNASRAEITSAVRAAIRERLAGRAVAAAPSASGPRPRDIGDEIEDSAFAVLAHYDDEDLFTILSAAPAIIDRIKPTKAVKDPGPAIGMSAS